MSVKMQQNARLQSDFYRDCYHKLLRFVVLEIFVMLLLISAIIYFVFFRPPPHYYATTTTGLVIPLTPTK